MMSLRTAVSRQSRTASSSILGANTSRPSPDTIGNHGVKRGFYIPRVTERRPDEEGPGGRTSNAGVTVAVFGAGGFLGRYVCYNLGSTGVKTYVGNRGDEFEMRHLNPMFDLGRLRKVLYSPLVRDSMAEVIADADVVVNLIGKHYETRVLANKPDFPYLYYKTNFNLEDANVTVPRTVAELCTEMQVDNLIHVSYLGAKEDATSEWARSKWRGEQAVKEAYPWATIVRPTQLFGHEDKLLNWFANAANKFPFVPLFDGGQALTQPVYVADVADVIARIIDEPERFEGRTIDCFGPQDFTYKELAAFVYDITCQTPRQVDLPSDIAKPLSEVTKYQPNPMLTPDVVDLWSTDDVAPMTVEEYMENKRDDALLTMEHVDVKATPIEKIAFEYLHRFRPGGHFLFTEGYHGKEVSH